MVSSPSRAKRPVPLRSHSISPTTVIARSPPRKQYTRCSSHDATRRSAKIRLHLRTRRQDLSHPGAGLAGGPREIRRGVAARIHREHRNGLRHRRHRDRGPARGRARRLCRVRQRLLRNQSFYEKHRRYKASSYAECVDAYYHNADHMIRCYLPGMYLSHLLWPQHYNMLRGFRDGMLRRLEKPKLFFEVGVGCGMYSKVLLEHFPDIRGIGFDISPYALKFTEDLVTLFDHGDRYTIEQRDIRHGYHESCDFLVCQEVLEHLENPEEFCRWLYDMITPGGHGYITAAVNAAHSDHIFHFRDPLQLEAMLRAAGFQPKSLQEEFAAGYKTRELTPSLAGYLVERRR